jgi:hypothetical protein
MVLSLASCAPNDERVRVGGAGGGVGGDVDARFTDHAKEYSRAMLIDLAVAARQTETVLQAATAAFAEAAGPEAPSRIPMPMPVTRVPVLRTAACRAVVKVPTAADKIEFETESKGCIEKGSTFEATQNGVETSSATVVKVAGQAPLASNISVVAMGVETILVAIKNPKDFLRVQGSRFLTADFVSEANGIRLYSFSFKSRSGYELNLKAMLDNGFIMTKFSGFFEFDVANQKITRFRSAAPADRIELKVLSNRKGRDGGKVARQQFLGVGTTADLAIDLAACALPIGSMKTRFTVGLIDADPDQKPNVDSTLELQSLKDSIVDKARLGLPKSVTSAKLCSADEQITVTEYFTGLLY